MMYLILEEKDTKNRIKLFSNKSEKVIDFITTKYDSEIEFLESLGLDKDKYSLIKNYSDKNCSIDFDFLSKDYEGIFDVLEDEASQDKFINTICNSDLEKMRIFICSEYLGRAKFRKNEYLWSSKEYLQDVLMNQDFLNEVDKDDKDRVERQKERYKKSLELLLYSGGEPVYNNFLSIYKFMCDEELIEKKNAYKEDLVKLHLSSEFKNRLKDYITKDGKFKSNIPDEELLTYKDLKGSIDRLRRKSKKDLIDPNLDSQLFYTSITENEDRDIDDFERDLDIQMDEEGLDDEDKIVVRTTMRDRYEKKVNKINKL